MSMRLLLAVGSAALLAVLVLGGRGRAGRRRLAGPTPYVRAAGRREMRVAPQEWDAVDEAADESFPASDPPATY